MSSVNYFRSIGLLNEECATLSELSSAEDRDLKATYCSGVCANVRHFSAKGVLVFVGDRYPKSCPVCKGSIVTHDTVTPATAERFWKQRRSA